MKPAYALTLFGCFLSSLVVVAQSISSSLPQYVERSEKFLFYLHGGVVTVLGNNAVNQSMPEWGPYEYLNILDSLEKCGFNIISENRKESVPDSFYSNKISRQIDTLLIAGVRPQHIMVLGASAGWDITINVSAILKNDELKFVIMGGCWPNDYKQYQHLQIYGRFLSVIERSDPHGSCLRIFEERKQLKSYKEITLATGLSHGFIYKGHKEWIDPIVAWFKEVD